MVTTDLFNQRLRQLTFYGLLVFLFVFLFLQMAAFLPALLGAVTFYVLSRKSMEYLVEKKNWKKSLAASVILLVSFLVVLVPVTLLINILSSRIGYAVENSNKIVDAVTSFVGSIESRFHISILNGNNSSSISATAANAIKKVLSATFNSVTSVVIMYFILYFMLVGKNRMEEWLFDFIPFKNSNVSLIGEEVKSLVISNALGIPLVALLQGVVGLIGYLFVGVNDVWFWFAFTCISSMLPFVGAAMAYVPLSIVLFTTDETLKGVIILIYGFGVIGTVDNIFRFVLQKKMGNVHPLITVFGVIIGLNIFGFIGLVFGPILISMFILLVKIYLNEFVERRKPTENQLHAEKQGG